MASLTMNTGTIDKPIMQVVPVSSGTGIFPSIPPRALTMTSYGTQGASFGQL